MSNYNYFLALKKLKKKLEEEKKLPKELPASGLVPKPQKADPEKTGKNQRSPIEQWLARVSKARDRYRLDEDNDYEGIA